MASSVKIFLLDASGVLNDFGFRFESGKKYFLTAEVAVELKDLRSKQLLENALQEKIAEIKNPKQNPAGEIEKLKEFGIERLSKADRSVLLLAIEMRNEKQEFEVLTDDYFLQNCLKFLKIPFKGIIHGEVSRLRNFGKKCRNCGKKFKKSYVEAECDLCGNTLK